MQEEIVGAEHGEWQAVSDGFSPGRGLNRDLVAYNKYQTAGYLSTEHVITDETECSEVAVGITTHLCMFPLQTLPCLS